MMKHALISYKWDKERTENKWLFWLQKKLEERNFNVILSPLETPRQKTEQWVGDIQALYSIPAENVYIVNHDPGCLTILKYLESLAGSEKIEQALLVAGVTRIQNFNGLSLPSQSEIYTKLQAPEQLSVSAQLHHQHKQSFLNIDARLVVLYSSSADALEYKGKPLLT